MEIKRAMEEIEKTKEASVYKITGPILVKVGKIELNKELEEKEEAINIRIKRLEKNEMELKDKLNEIKDRLTSRVGG